MSVFTLTALLMEIGGFSSVVKHDDAPCLQGNVPRTPVSRQGLLCFNRLKQWQLQKVKRKKVRALLQVPAAFIPRQSLLPPPTHTHKPHFSVFLSRISFTIVVVVVVFICCCLEPIGAFVPFVITFIPLLISTSS